MFDFDTLSEIAGFGDYDFGFVRSLSPKDTGGPVVKTGPTAGQNRSRNKDGRWRKKRSDAGQPKTNNI